MSRYKSVKLSNLGPVHGFIIHTPDDPKLKDVYPQFIVRELNRMADRINKLEEAGDRMRLYCADPDDCFAWDKAKKAKL